MIIDMLTSSRERSVFLQYLAMTSIFASYWDSPYTHRPIKLNSGVCNLVVKCFDCPPVLHQAHTIKECRLVLDHNQVLVVKS